MDNDSVRLPKKIQELAPNEGVRPITMMTQSKVSRNLGTRPETMEKMSWNA